MWFTHLNTLDSPQLRIFCFPFAGGSALYFKKLVPYLPAGVQLTGVQLPGRGTRIMEPPATRIVAVVRMVANAFEKERFSVPFIFLGHSMGGLIGFELVRELRRRALETPVLLMASACRAPQIAAPTPPIHGLPDRAFMEAVHAIGGTPDDVLDHAEMMRVFLPVLRADFTLCETYQYKEEPKLNCPILAVGGDEDVSVKQTMLEAWAEHTTQPFALKMFPGNHFYLDAHRHAILATLFEHLQEHTPIKILN